MKGCLTHSILSTIEAVAAQAGMVSLKASKIKIYCETRIEDHGFEGFR